MIVHLVDGTYELFRHFYGLRRFTDGVDPPYGAVNGVLHTVLQMIEGGATHVGVATDHVIESFRNGLWPGYKTSEGMEPALLSQFHPLEAALAAMGVAGLINLAMLFVASGLFSMFYFVGQYIQVVLGYSAIETGVGFAAGSGSDRQPPMVSPPITGSTVPVMYDESASEARNTAACPISNAPLARK